MPQIWLYRCSRFPTCKRMTVQKCGRFPTCRRMTDLRCLKYASVSAAGLALRCYLPWFDSWNALKPCGRGSSVQCLGRTDSNHQEWPLINIGPSNPQNNQTDFNNSAIFTEASYCEYPTQSTTEQTLRRDTSATLDLQICLPVQVRLKGCQGCPGKISYQKVSGKILFWVHSKLWMSLPLPLLTQFRHCRDVALPCKARTCQGHQVSWELLFTLDDLELIKNPNSANKKNNIYIYIYYIHPACIFIKKISLKCNITLIHFIGKKHI